MNAITDEKYVSFTTFRRGGQRVSTPVWIVDLGNGTAGFTTQSNSGKAKRLLIDSQVELQRCDARGRVADDAEMHIGTAQLVEGKDFDRVAAAINEKYGFQVRLIKAIARITRREASDRGVLVTLD